MTGVRKFIAAFESANKNLTVTTVVDYDNNSFLVEAMEDLDNPDKNDPWYRVNKKTGKTTPFSPMFEMDKFFDAIENRRVYSYGE